MTTTPKDPVDALMAMPDPEKLRTAAHYLDFPFMAPSIKEQHEAAAFLRQCADYLEASARALAAMPAADMDRLTELERHNKALVERRQYDVADIHKYCAMVVDLEKRLAAPIDMLLYCPNCGVRHVDAPEPHLGPSIDGSGDMPLWTNPPHRSHLCHSCGCIWRPADVPTNGVEAIKTEGKADTWPVPHNEEVTAALAQQAGGVPAGFVSLGPTPEMIDAGAQRLVSFEENSVWPDSWDALQVAAARNEAERVWRSMWLAAAPSPSAVQPLSEAQRQDLLAAALYLSARDDDTAILTEANAERIIELLCDLSGIELHGIVTPKEPK